MSGQEPDQTFDIIANHLIAIYQLFVEVRKAGTGKLPPGEKMEEDSTSAKKWLEITLESRRKKIVEGG